MKNLGFKLYGANVNPACKLCEKYMINGENGTCVKKGEVSPFDKCFRFKYDPLKRIPSLANELEHFDKSDFSLDIEESEEDEA